MTVYWPVFFASAAVIFIILNTVFAFLYWLGDDPIANVSPELPLPLSLFYFSIETLATVGYGDMHPQTNYGHLVATVEIFTGMSLSGGDDRPDLRPLLAAEGPLRVRQISGGRQAPGPADADDPHRQCPPQHDLPGDCAAVAVARWSTRRKAISSAAFTS